MTGEAEATWLRVSYVLAIMDDIGTNCRKLVSVGGEANHLLPASQALAGPHFYTWGDHGGLLMAVPQGGATTHLK